MKPHRRRGWGRASTRCRTGLRAGLAVALGGAMAPITGVAGVTGPGWLGGAPALAAPQRAIGATAAPAPTSAPTPPSTSAQPPVPASAPSDRLVTANCVGLGTFTVGLPSGVTTPALPPEVQLSVGYRAIDTRTRAHVTGGQGAGDTQCATVAFTNLTAAQVSSASPPAGVAANDRLAGTWLVSVTVSVAPAAPAGPRPFAAAATAAPAAATAAPAAAVQTSSPFISSIQSYLASRGGSASAAIYDATDGITYAVSPQNSYVTASIVKVDILATRLRQAQDAGHFLSSQDQATATQMIEVSDNNAATALWNEDGGGPGVAGFNGLVPMPNTFPGSGGLWGLTRTTALDQVSLVRQVAYANSILGPSQRSYQQGLMENVTPSQRWGVSGGVPGGVTIALKNGWLPVSGGWETNSVGHIFGQGKDYVIAVLTSGSPSMGYGITTIQGVSAIVWSQLPPPAPPGGPSMAVAANGNRFVFYRGGDSNLWEVIWNGSAWTGPYDLGMGPLGSEPSADVDANGSTHVYWQGADANLWEGFWTGSGWSGARFIGMGPLRSRPAATVSASGTQYVFWKGADGNLIQAIGTSGGPWGGPYDQGMGPLGSEPSADIDAAGRTSAFWKGGDGNLWQGFWTGTKWSGARFIGMGPLNSRPSATESAGGTQYVFWKGADGNLWQAIGTNGSPFAGPYNLGMGALGSEPSAGIDANGRTYVVWRGGDGNLWQGYWTGTGWSGAISVGIPVS